MVESFMAFPAGSKKMNQSKVDLFLDLSFSIYNWQIDDKKRFDFEVLVTFLNLLRNAKKKVNDFVYFLWPSQNI